MSIQHILFTGIAIFSFLCIIAVLFFERKNPASSLTWVLVLLFLPVIGFVFYLFLGTGFRVDKRKKFALKAASDDLYNNHLIKHLDPGHSRIFRERHAHLARMLTYLKNQGDGFFTDNNAADIFTDGGELFDRLLGDLRRAKNHIHLLFFIFRNDSLGREIVSILEERARSGVKVRLMYDSVGTLMARGTMFEALKRAGGEVHAFSPIFSSLNSHLRLNYRNHRKIAVIDGKAGYVGGMNIGDEYRGRGRSLRLRPWRDTHLRITGSAVWFLQERFLMDWSYSSDLDIHALAIDDYFPEPSETGNIPVQIVSSGPDTHEVPIKSAILSMIYAAQKSIYIQTPYFSPDVSLADALRIAVHSDVDVRLMVPLVSDYDIVHRTTLGYVRDMLELGVKVYFYKGFIHAKTMVIDGEAATIGTTNLTHRSFTLDFEVNAFMHDSAFAARCVDIFHADMENSVAVEEDYFRKKNLVARASYNVARMLAPMM